MANQRPDSKKPPAGRAAGKVAIVTGGGGAIGRATAVLLAREGARVVVTEQSGQGGEDTVALLTAGGGTAIYFPHDVTLEDDWRRLVDATLNRWHRLDILAHTVHEPLERSLADFTVASLRAYQQRNLLAPWLGLKYCGPAVRPHGKGAIALVSSAAGMAATAGGGGPGMAVAALRMMARAAAAEFAERNPRVRVNTVLADPAYFALPHTPRPEPAHPRRGRSPYDVAHAVLYLTADAARFMTGTELVVANPADAAA